LDLRFVVVQDLVLPMAIAVLSNLLDKDVG
jgi:hypothetical protein